MPGLTPEAMVEQLRVMRAQLDEVTPLTNEQVRLLKRNMRMSNAELQASINALGASDHVSLAVGQPPEEVRRMHDESNRWTAAEDELRSLLNGVAGANLIRRQRVQLYAMQAFAISKQLARIPAHAMLLPHVLEIKRLRRIARRRRGTQTPEPPAPEPAAEAVEAVEPETSGSAEAADLQERA